MIEKHIKAFLESGGKITVCPPVPNPIVRREVKTDDY